MQRNCLPEPLSIMGVDVIPFESYSHAVRCVADIVAAGGKSSCFAVNPEKIQRSGGDAALSGALARSDIGICDGVGVVLAARVLHGVKLSRCTGADLFMKLMAEAAEKSWRVFLLGASPESNAQACSVLQERYPGLMIVGRCDGYFDDSAAVVEQINASGADLLFVAMGSPKQELWIAEHREAINAQFCMGVGGTFDVLSGKAKRAPGVFRKTGTEFLFRLMKEPWRWKRQTVLPVFMWNVLKQRVFPVRSVTVQQRNDR